MQNIKAIFNGIGLQRLSQPIAIPNTELGVDTGEDLKPQQLKVEYQNNKQFVVVTQPTMYQYLPITGHTQPLDPENLPKDFYFGEVRGSF